MRKLTVDLAWKYLNMNLLARVDQSTLESHPISLPISWDTAWSWMIKCGANRCGTEKTYYNNQHQSPEVLLYRKAFLSKLRCLQRRMKVWVILSVKEESKYIKFRESSLFPEAMAVGEEVVIDNQKQYTHHMDDQDY